MECVKCLNNFESDGPMDMVCPSCLARSASEGRRDYIENVREYSLGGSVDVMGGGNSEQKQIKELKEKLTSSENEAKLAWNTMEHYEKQYLKLLNDPETKETAQKARRLSDENKGLKIKLEELEKEMELCHEENEEIKEKRRRLSNENKGLKVKILELEKEAKDGSEARELLNSIKFQILQREIKLETHTETVIEIPPKK